MKQGTSSADRFAEERNRRDSFVELWEKANLIRSFLWSQEIADEKFAPDLPPGITSDRIKFKQIVRNLIDNAVTCTERGRVAVKAQRKDDMLEISVADTGVGIGTENLKKVFDPHSDEDSIRSRQEGRLGLSLIKELVDLLKGHIHVRSQPGVGSEFTGCLPVDAPMRA